MKKYYQTMFLSSAASMLETFIATGLVTMLLDKINWLTVISASIVAGLLQMVAYIAGNEDGD